MYRHQRGVSQTGRVQVSPSTLMHTPPPSQICELCSLFLIRAGIGNLLGCRYRSVNASSYYLLIVLNDCRLLIPYAITNHITCFVMESLVVTNALLSIGEIPFMLLFF